MLFLEEFRQAMKRAHRSGADLEHALALSHRLLRERLWEEYWQHGTPLGENQRGLETWLACGTRTRVN